MDRRLNDGAGLAALVVITELLGRLVACGVISAGDVRNLLDTALLDMEGRRAVVPPRFWPGWDAGLTILSELQPPVQRRLIV